MKLAYFVHDLADAAVHRRVSMLADIADLIVVGFRRTDQPVTELLGRDVIDLGRTFDARFAHRAGSVLSAMVTSSRWQAALAGTQLFLARQLEMLALAAAVRRRIAAHAALVFECLDIHRLMLGSGPTGLVLRAVERRLLRACDMLIISSPGFLAGHFQPVHRTCPRTLLLENKVLESDIDTRRWPEVGRPGAGGGMAVGPPWRLGWYGVIRCRRSLETLAGLVRALPGEVEVVIRGRPSHTVLPDFDRVVAATPGMSFLGPYDRARELAQIYRDVHFTWTLDFYESPGNSDWLLPNRLYEGSVFGCVPLAMRSVETGRWLARHGCGILLDEPLHRSLVEFFRGLDAAAYGRARGQIGQIPLADLIAERDACAEFAAVLTALGRGLP